MNTLQAERPLDSDILPFPGANRTSAPPACASQAAQLPAFMADDASTATVVSAFGDRNDSVLVPSPVVGLALALAQASMLWPVLRPV